MEIADRFYPCQMLQLPHEIAIQTSIAFDDRCNRCAERMLRAISFVSISSPDQNDEELFASAILETKPDPRRTYLWPKTVERYNNQPYKPYLSMLLPLTVNQQPLTEGPSIATVVVMEGSGARIRNDRSLLSLPNVAVAAVDCDSHIDCLR